MTDRMIKYREHIEAKERFHSFTCNDGTTCGWSFPVDDDGKPILNDCSKNNWEKAQRGVADGTVLDDGIVEFDASYYEPAICKCDCGAKVTLDDSWANGCDRCGREYNMSGQLLAPREQWGEETGECFV